MYFIKRFQFQYGAINTCEANYKNLQYAVSIPIWCYKYSIAKEPTSHSTSFNSNMVL